MICSKIFPCFYMIDLEGSVISAIFGDEYGIETATVASEDFNTDIEAYSALQNGAVKVLKVSGASISDADEELHFNEKFYPPKQLDGITTDELEDSSEEALLNAIEVTALGDMSVAITNEFDAMGDYVVSRWTLSSQHFFVEGRILVNLYSYLHYRGYEELKKHDIKSTRFEEVFHVH